MICVGVASCVLSYYCYFLTTASGGDITQQDEPSDLISNIRLAGVSRLSMEDESCPLASKGDASGLRMLERLPSRVSLRRSISSDKRCLRSTMFNEFVKCICALGGDIGLEGYLFEMKDLVTAFSSSSCASKWMLATAEADGHVSMAGESRSSAARAVSSWVGSA